MPKDLISAQTHEPFGTYALLLLLRGMLLSLVDRQLRRDNETYDTRRLVSNPDVVVLSAQGLFVSDRPTPRCGYKKVVALNLSHHTGILHGLIVSSALVLSLPRCYQTS